MAHVWCGRVTLAATKGGAERTFSYAVLFAASVSGEPGLRCILLIKTQNMDTFMNQITCLMLQGKPLLGDSSSWCNDSMIHGDSVKPRSFPPQNVL